MGTPEFAVESLRRLVEGGYNVVGVITMPDKPVGRHQDTLQASAVKQYAVAHGLPVLQPEKLKELYRTRDFGRYARPDGTMPVAFLSDNDITGGNSGSPVLNADGHLVGLAFDGNWESMSGDVMFEPELQRCINVDIRYVLFIIDKFGGASWLLDEMDFAD